MKKPLILLLTVMFFMVNTQNAYGQQKYEKESRINLKNVPSAALDFINALDITSRIKWYSEVGLESKSIEAKFKLDNKCHSVEFDTTGTIQDIEIELKLQELQSQLMDTINDQLSRMCSRHKISKIQIQYSGSETNLLSFLKGEATTKSLITNYEIIVKCMNNKNTELYEYLFNDEGRLLETYKIIFKNSSNLEY